jgi:hypothetical protein
MPPHQPAHGNLPTLRGGSYLQSKSVYCFKAAVLGKQLSLGKFKPEEAEVGARKYDALQLLVYGPRAETNFEWSSYAQADVAAAAQFLQDKGLDVHQAVLCARQSRFGCEWYGVVVRGVAWAAKVQLCKKEGSQRVDVAWSVSSSAEAAARQADCGRLAMRGLGCTTNFPASSYTKLQLEEAGRHATSKGVDAARVAACLEAVEQVCVRLEPGCCAVCICRGVCMVWSCGRVGMPPGGQDK